MNPKISAAVMTFLAALAMIAIAIPAKPANAQVVTLTLISTAGGDHWRAANCDRHSASPNCHLHSHSHLNPHANHDVDGHFHI